MTESRPKVFISYSHDSGLHRERVLGLSERLRQQDGIESQLDQYINGTPPDGWPRWMEDSVDAADFVLVVCTQTYHRRFRGHEVPGKGKGVDWEGAIISQELYDARSKITKFVPILFDARDEDFVPRPLRKFTTYTVDADAGYEALRDFLFGQAGVEPGQLADPQPRPRRRGRALVFDRGASQSTPPVHSTSELLLRRAEQIDEGAHRPNDRHEALRLEAETPLREMTGVQDPSDVADEQALLFARRSERRAKHAVLGVMLAVASAVLGLSFYSHRQHKRYISTLVRDLSGCLVGAPLKNGESILLRLRAIQLVEGQYETGWPVNCLGRAKALTDALKDDSKEQLIGAIRYLTEHLTLLGGPNSDNKIMAVIIELQRSSIASGPGEAPVQPRRLDPYASVDTVDRTKVLSKTTIPAESIQLDSYQDTARHFFVKDATLDMPPLGCRVAGETCDCFELPGEPSGPGEVSALGTTAVGGSPVILAGGNGSRAAFRATTGARIAAESFNSAYAGESGYVALQSQGAYDVAGNGYTVRLLEQLAPDTEPKETILGPGSLPAEFPHVHRAEILWDRLFLHVMQRKPASHQAGDYLEQRILVYPLPFTGQGTIIGTVDHINSSFSGCRSEKLGVMRFGYKHSVMSIRRNKGSWSAPVLSEDVRGALYCDDANVFLLHEESDGLTSWRCKESGCDSAIQNVIPGAQFKIASEDNLHAAALVGGQLFFVWRAANAGGIRMRLARPEAFATASDSVLFDDMVEGGRLASASTATSLSVVALGNSVVVILGTTVGTYLFQIDSVGKVTPLAPWSKGLPG